MELREYIRVLQKNINILVATTLICGALALGVSLNISDKYEALLSIYVQKVPEQPGSGDFTYDGFYAQQAAEAFTDTAVGLFESTTTAQRALEIEGVNAEIREVRSLNSKTTVEKVAPQLIEVSVIDVSREYAITKVGTLFNAVEEKVTSAQRNTAGGLSITRMNEDPLVMLRQPLTWLNTAVGILVGILLGVFIIAIKVYAQGNKHNE